MLKETDPLYKVLQLLMDMPEVDQRASWATFRSKYASWKAKVTDIVEPLMRGESDSESESENRPKILEDFFREIYVVKPHPTSKIFGFAIYNSDAEAYVSDNLGNIVFFPMAPRANERARELNWAAAEDAFTASWIIDIK